ncbi:hypothetical protein [Streptococcus minor]|uniref:hypothetical protein n=1 Tax=Streptococcus minor TaxID=229549 RepID=UPI00037C1FB3|nr:hypothetical protein [Streptococcus minor]
MKKKSPKDNQGTILTVKKPFYKRTWFVVLAVLFGLGIIINIFTDDKHQKDAAVSDTKEVNTITSTVDSTEEPKATSIAIQLIAGEKGDYGQSIVMNEGTDMPEELIVYYLPAGIYEVENIGSFPAQITVYEGFTRDESTGYDNYTASGDAKLIDKGAKDTITVPENWFVEIHEPAKFSLVKQ